MRSLDDGLAVSACASRGRRRIRPDAAQSRTARPDDLGRPEHRRRRPSTSSWRKPGIKYDYCDVPTPDMLAAASGWAGRNRPPASTSRSTTDTAKFPAGTPYKAVIFAIGASLKGMGASGLTLDSEEARLKKLIEFCKQKKILVMAVHIGGESKRGAAGSDNERMIDAVAPFADYIVVTKDSNKDGRFTKIAKAKNIPLTEIEYALGLVDIVKRIFQ